MSHHERENSVTSPVITHDDFLKMRERPVDTDNRLRVATMVHRNVIFVAGQDLADAAERNIRLKSTLRPGSFSRNFKNSRDYDTGIQAMKLQYAPSITIIAAAFGWGETNPSMRVLSTQLYEHKLGVRIKNLAEAEEVEKIRRALQSKRAEYINDHKEELNMNMDIILKFFIVNLPDVKRRVLRQMLSNGETDSFLNALLRAQGNLE